MKIDQIDINALKFGILCNFAPFCGEERAKESVEIVRELERLAEIGRAAEKAFNGTNAFVSGLWFKHPVDSVERLLEWATQEGKAGEGTE